jgi:predicted RNA binding protein YcfA (HicA-like mRNA interferase family)
MSRWKKRLTAKEVRRIVKTLGFRHQSDEGGHEHWVRDEPQPFRKVTISAHVAPFGHDLIRYMAKQAGVSIRDFYEALDR